MPSNVCPNCDYSKFVRTSDKLRVCSNCGTAVPTLREMAASRRVTVTHTAPTAPPVSRKPRIDKERPMPATPIHPAVARVAAAIAKPPKHRPAAIRRAALTTVDAVTAKRAARVDTPAAVTYAFDKLIAARRAGTSTVRAEKAIALLALSPADAKRQAKAARARARRNAAS